VKSGTYTHTRYELLPSLVATLLECPSSPRSVAAAIVAYAASTVASVKKQHPLTARHAITLRNMVQLAQRTLAALRLIFPAGNRELGQIRGSCGLRELEVTLVVVSVALGALWSVHKNPRKSVGSGCLRRTISSRRR
jgi:hypothetical protein